MPNSSVYVSSSNQSDNSRYVEHYVRCIVESPYYNVSVNMDQNVSSVNFVTTNPDNINPVATQNNNTVALKQGVSYKINASYNTGYGFKSWSTSGNGTLKSTSDSNTTYQVSSTATLTLESRAYIGPNPPASCSTPVPGITYMQDIKADNKVSVLNNMITDNAYFLRDSRDGEPYCVSKLADGNIWMLDNLAIDLATTSVELLKGLTNASDVSIDYLKGVRKRNVNNSYGNYATAGVADYWMNVSSYSLPLMSVKSKDDIPNGAVDGSKGSNKTGGYYNFCAASAGSYCYDSLDPFSATYDDATEDICPTEWRMPTGGPNGEYNALAVAIIGGDSDSYRDDDATSIRRSLSLPLSSYITEGHVDYNELGRSGTFLSSTKYNSADMYSLSAYTASNSPVINPSLGAHNYSAYSVRCILRPAEDKYPVMVHFETGINNVSFYNNEYGTQVVHVSGENVYLKPGIEYTVTASLAANYEIVKWETTEFGMLGDITLNPTTYSTTGIASLLVTTSLKQNEITNISEIKYLQDFANLSATEKTTVINSMTPNQTYQLQDSRDKKNYTLAILPDGKIWMTSNLNLSGTTIISSNESDAPTDNYFKLPTSTQIGSNLHVQIGVLNSSRTLCEYEKPCYSYYTWPAATLGAMDTNGKVVSNYKEDTAYSVCPKGWKLPAYNDWVELFDIYKNMYGDDGNTVERATSNGTVANLQLSGKAYFYGSGRGLKIVGGNSDGYYSTSTAYYRGMLTSYEHIIFHYGYSPGTESVNSAYQFESVRCILGQD